MKNYLKLLGVSDDLLSKEEKIFLDVNGYLNLGKVLSDDEIETILGRIDVLLQDEGGLAGSELADSPHIRHPKEAGANRLADLVNKGDIFDLFMPILEYWPRSPMFWANILSYPHLIIERPYREMVCKNYM